MRTFTALLVAMCLGAGEPSAPLREALATLDPPLRASLPWIVSLYDPTSGGFRISRAAVDRGLAADFQSTTQAVFILAKSGVLPHMPAAWRENLIRYVASRQRDDGWFVDPAWPQVEADPRLLGRSFQFCLLTLETLGAKPSHPRPSDQALPPHLASPQAWRDYIRSLNWKKPWGAVDRISAQGAFFTGMSPERKAALVAVAREEIAARQDPDTGWVGQGPPTETISACAKLGWFCLKVGEPIPHADAIQRSVLSWYRREEDVATLTLVRNPIHHLADLQAFVTSGGPDPAQLTAIVRYSGRQIARFVRPDHGLSMHIREFPVRPNDMTPPAFTASAPQGDLNGTSQAFTVREQAWKLAGAQAPPLVDAAAAAALFTP